MQEKIFYKGRLTYCVFHGVHSIFDPSGFQLESINAIIFVIDISSYDQSAYGQKHRDDERFNEKSNLLWHSLHEFNLMSSSWASRQASIILLFNESDRFKERLRVTPLQKCFPDYQDGSGYQVACDYIREKFISHQDPHRQVYTHFISGVQDPNLWPFVMASVDDIICAENITNFQKPRILANYLIGTQQRSLMNSYKVNQSLKTDNCDLPLPTREQEFEYCKIATT